MLGAGDRAGAPWQAVRAGRPRSVGRVRLGVLDVGSNTVRLLVVDAHPGANPQPAASEGTPLRLASLLDGSGALSPEGATQLVDVVAMRGGPPTGSRSRSSWRSARPRCATRRTATT